MAESGVGGGVSEGKAGPCVCRKKGPAALPGIKGITMQTMGMGGVRFMQKETNISMRKVLWQQGEDEQMKGCAGLGWFDTPHKEITTHAS